MSEEEKVCYVWRISRPRKSNSYVVEIDKLGVFIDDRSLGEHFKYQKNGVIQNARIISSNFTCIVAAADEKRLIEDAIQLSYNQAITEVADLLNTLQKNKTEGAKWL